MPELPEVETIRRGMERAMAGRIIQAVAVLRRDLRVPVSDCFEEILTGQRVKSLVRRGKYIIISLSGGVHAILHLGMSGRIHIAPINQTPPLKHEHVILMMDDGLRISFEDPRRFGMFYLSPAAQWQDSAPFVSMGPEPLSPEWSGGILYQAMKNRSAPVKQVLLDQQVIAGLGNIYVCEALYRAGIDPRRAGKLVTYKEVEILCAHVRDVLYEAIASGGSTLKDYKHTDGAMGYFQHGFKVYGRAGEICSSDSCEQKIRRIVQSGRSTFYCPFCQT